MTSETESLVLEILKRLPSDMSVVRSDMGNMRNELTAIKGHMAAFMSHEWANDGGIAGIKQRLDRLERRLELRD